MLPIQVGGLRLLVLILLGEIKTFPTIFGPNLKQALLNTDQDNEQCPGPYPGFPDYGHELHYSGAYKYKTHMSIYFLPSSTQRKHTS